VAALLWLSSLMLTGCSQDMWSPWAKMQTAALETCQLPKILDVSPSHVLGSQEEELLS